MAVTGSLTNTVLQAAIVRAARAFNEFEGRDRSGGYGAFAAILDDTSKTIPASTLEAAKTSNSRLTKIPVLKKYTATNVDADTCTFVGDSVSSDLIYPTYTPIGFAVENVAALYRDNYIVQEEALAFQLQMGFQKAFSRLETLAVAHIAGAKHSLTGITSNYFTVASNTATLAGTQEERMKFYGYVPNFLKKFGLGNGMPLIEVANTEALTSDLIRQAYGVQNSVNYAGLSGGLAGSGRFKTYTTNAIVPSGLETRYIFEQGSHGVLNWVDKKATSGDRVSEANYWTTMIDPVFGLQWGVHYSRDCGDYSARHAGGGIDAANVREGWLIFAQFAFMKKYSSDTTSTTVKFDLNNPA